MMEQEVKEEARRFEAQELIFSKKCRDCSHISGSLKISERRHDFAVKTSMADLRGSGSSSKVALLLLFGVLRKNDMLIICINLTGLIEQFKEQYRLLVESKSVLKNKARYSM